MNRIPRRRALGILTSATGAAAFVALTGVRPLYAEEETELSIDGRVVAVGIPGASAVSPVGTFLPGGPIHDNPVLAAFTQPGRVLDPTRILVGSRSNFGAPKANADQSAGALLSLATDGKDVLSVPPTFASAGDQASALGGAVMTYSAARSRGPTGDAEAGTSIAAFPSLRGKGTRRSSVPPARQGPP